MSGARPIKKRRPGSGRGMLVGNYGVQEMRQSVGVVRTRAIARERRDVRLDMPTKAELEAAIAAGRCWWCGTETNCDGKPMRHWGQHYVNGHGLNLTELRDILMVGVAYGFVTEGLSRELATRPQCIQSGAQAKRMVAVRTGVARMSPYSERKHRSQRAKRVCRGCGDSFWLPAGRKTCSIACSRKVMSDKASDPAHHARGERCGRTVLTDAQVVAIREEYAAGRTSQDALARKYGADQGGISAIVLGKTWAHVDGPIAKPMPLAQRAKKRCRLQEQRA